MGKSVVVLAPLHTLNHCWWMLLWCESWQRLAGQEFISCVPTTSLLPSVNYTGRCLVTALSGMCEAVMSKHLSWILNQHRMVRDEVNEARRGEMGKSLCTETWT